MCCAGRVGCASRPRSACRLPPGSQGDARQVARQPVRCAGRVGHASRPCSACLLPHHVLDWLIPTGAIALTSTRLPHPLTLLQTHSARSTILLTRRTRTAGSLRSRLRGGEAKPPGQAGHGQQARIVSSPRRQAQLPDLTRQMRVLSTFSDILTEQPGSGDAFGPGCSGVRFASVLRAGFAALGNARSTNFKTGIDQDRR